MKKSSLWISPAWPEGVGQPDYINAVIKARYDGEPEALMTILLEVETQLGRVRSVKNAPRTLDLDLLTFGNEKRRTDALRLPHPRMMERAFVLLPLCDIDPSWAKYARRLPNEQILATRYAGSW